MADKTIGSLPAAETVDDTSLLVMEQQGAAMKVTGALIKGYAAAAVAGYVNEAKEAAETASAASGEAEKASQDAEAASMEAQNAQQGAEKARRAIENLGVEGETLDPGQQVAVVKTVGADGVVTLTFQIPQGERGETGDTGDQGETGPQGVSVTDAEITEDGELILTLSNQQTVNAGHVVGQQGPQGVQGEPGSSVTSVQRTQGTGAAGTADTYTMYNEDGEAVGTFQVYNGLNGTGVGDFMADGSVPMTGALNLSGYRATLMGWPQGDTDGATKQYVDDTVNDTVDKALSGFTIQTDEVPTQFSQNPVQSGGVYTALQGKQDQLSGGTQGQVLTKGLGMAVEWKDLPQTGMTQEQADQRYLKLSGGTMQGDVNFSAGEDPSMSRGVKFTVNMESAHLHGLNEGSGTILEASDQMGELVRLRFADPVASTDGATKGYVDGKAPKLVTITLAASAWSNGSQAVTVAGVKSSGQSVRISPATKADADNWVSAGVWCNEPATANQLTFTCDTAPEADIGINVELQEVQG